jgi:uncharacterized protein (DUF2384 family)
MSQTQLSSVDEPFASHREAATLAVRLWALTPYLGIAFPELAVLNGSFVRLMLHRFADAGVAVDASRQAETASTGDEFATLLRLALNQAEHSPMPQGEWPQLVGTLGDSLLAEVLGISVSSVRRYAATERPTPQTVAVRLHFLALLVADLAGAYNEYGIRRWFTRPRSRLDGRRPIDLLGARFDPEGPDADSLRALVDSLVFAGAT